MRANARRGPGQPQLVRFRAILAAEAAVSVVVLGVTAALVVSQPGRLAHAQAVPPSVPLQTAPPAEPDAAAVSRVGFDAADPGGQGFVELALVPAVLGRNELHLAVLDTSGQPLDVAEVTASMSLPERTDGWPYAVPLRKLGPGHYVSRMSTSVAGRWQLAVTLDASAANRATVVTHIDVSR